METASQFAARQQKIACWRHGGELTSKAKRQRAALCAVLVPASEVLCDAFVGRAGLKGPRTTPIVLAITVFLEYSMNAMRLKNDRIAAQPESARLLRFF